MTMCHLISPCDRNHASCDDQCKQSVLSHISMYHHYCNIVVETVMEPFFLIENVFVMIVVLAARSNLSSTFTWIMSSKMVLP